MYKVFKVQGGWQIFYCPSVPLHYSDKVPYSEKVYPQPQGAHRRCAQLNDRAQASAAERAPFHSSLA